MLNGVTDAGGWSDTDTDTDTDDTIYKCKQTQLSVENDPWNDPKLVTNPLEKSLFKGEEIP